MVPKEERQHEVHIDDDNKRSAEESIQLEGKHQLVINRAVPELAWLYAGYGGYDVAGAAGERPGDVERGF